MADKVCFLICPIGESDSETRQRSDTVFEYILKPVMQQKGYELLRADQIIQNDEITKTIIEHLENDYLVIADISEANPNVYYELGYREALKKPVIQIATENTKLPFDVSIKRTFYYDKDLPKAENFKTLLLTLIDNIESNIQENTDNTSKTLNDKLAQQLIEKIFLDPQSSSSETMDNILKIAALANDKK